MAKIIGLKIEIEGLSQITKEVTGLEQQLKGLNDQLAKTEVGSEEYIKLKNQIVLTQDALKDTRKEQRDFIKDAKAADFKKGSYFDLNKQLVDLRKEYKNLSEAERNSAKGTELQKKIQTLDKELKSIDGNIGQFQRNVGNYPKTFALVTRSLTRSIPGFEAFSSTLKDAEGNMSLFGKALIGGFVAFQGAKLIAGAIKGLDEFNTKMKETRDTVAEFSGAYGEDLDNVTASTKALADTFNTDAKTISEAAKSLSKTMGISFEEALVQIEGALVEGRGNANEYLEKIKEFPTAFTAASGAMGPLAQQNERLLSANKELAKSQVAIAKQTQELGDNFKVVTATVKNTLLVILLRLIDVFKPLYTAAYELFAALNDLGKAMFSVFTGGKETVNLLDVFTGALNLLISPLKVAINFITEIVNLLKPFASLIGIAAAAIVGYRVAMVAASIATKAQAAATVAYNIVVNLFTNLTKAATLAQKAFNLAMKANPIGLVVGGLIAAGGAIAGYTSMNKDATDSIDDRAEAERKAAEEEEKAAAARRKIEEERIAAEEARLEAEKKAEDERKKREAEAQARFKKLQEERQKFKEREEKDDRSRAALLADLQARFLDESIKNIQDAQERQLKQTEIGFQKQIEALDKNYEALQLAAKEREAELIKIFGQNAKEVLQVQKANAEQLAKLAEEQAKIRVEIEKQREAELAKVREEFKQKEIEDAKKAAEELRQIRDNLLNTELQFIDDVNDMRSLKNKEVLNRLLIQETDAKKREELIRLAAEQETADKIAEIRNKIQAVDDQEAFLKAQAEIGVEIKQEEYDAILKARQQLNTELSDLELQQTERVKIEAQKQKNEFVKAFEGIASAFEKGLSVLNSFLDAANEREQARLDEAASRSEKREERLNKELQGATGLRRKFIQQQIDNELAAQEQLEKQKEELARKAAIKDKAIAITQSLIQGALAVSRALAAPPGFPANLPFVIGTGVFAAAQTAAIAAKKFEDGGLIEGPRHSEGGVPFTVQGRGGFEAEGGEYIINKKATKRFLPVLQKINSVKFAQGGLIGGVATSPTVSSTFGSAEQQIRSFNERTNALNRQQVETRVYLVTDDLDRDTDDKNRIKKRVTLE
jgi:hypothetical protein